MILAIDFDDVLMDPTYIKPGKRMGEPIPGAIEGMQALQQAGHIIIIHTVRGDRPEHVEQWLDFFGIPYNEVTRTKPEADFYLDDKALPFLSWDLTLRDLLDGT